ncbi:MAG TPA: YqiA/YcfP family alpha/beta fold hydrolase [Thermoanaerobaculia bacterium]
MRVPSVFLYLHGFASSPAGRKIALLREAFAPDGIEVLAPNLNRPSFERLDFGAMADEAVRAATGAKPAVVIGSSLGALVALEAARRGVTAPLVLVAPALGFGPRWTDKLAPGDPVRFFHHGAGKELSIHRRFFEQMAKVDVDREPPPTRVTIVMGEKDESVPFESVRETWRRWEASGRLIPGSRFLTIPGGDHGLVDHVPTIASAIREAGNIIPPR